MLSVYCFSYIAIGKSVVQACPQPLSENGSKLIKESACIYGSTPLHLAADLIVRQIHIRTSTGNSISIPFCQSMKLSELKKKIWRDEGIPPYQQQLLYAGRTLEGDRTLEDYCIVENDILYLELTEGRSSGSHSGKNR